MGNETTPAPGETPSGGTPPGEMPTPQGPGETPGTSPPLSIDDALRQIESLQSALKKANAESASHRVKAKELDDLKAKAEADKLSETERLQKQLAKLQSDHDTALRTHQERTISYEVRLQATQAGIVDPDAAAKLLDWSLIEYDEAGNPTNIDKLLRDLLKAKQYLAGGKPIAPTSGGATNPSRAASGRPATIDKEYVTRLMAGGSQAWSALTPDEQQQVSAWIKAGGLLRR